MRVGSSSITWPFRTAWRSWNRESLLISSARPGTQKIRLGSEMRRDSKS